MEAKHSRGRRQSQRAIRRVRFLRSVETQNEEGRGVGPTEEEYAKRREELLKECKVPAKVFQEVDARLKSFLEPFLETFTRREQDEHAERYVSGLLSELEQKNAESIAYLYGDDRLGLQRFIGWADWDDAPLLKELARQVGTELGAADGVLVFDPSSFPKSGRDSVGVARQWCGRLGKIENCQVAVYLGYVSSEEHALVDMRIYLPQVMRPEFFATGSARSSEPSWG